MAGTLIIQDHQLMVLLQAYSELVEERPHEDSVTQHDRRVFLNKLTTFYAETIQRKRFVLVALPESPKP